MTEITDQDRLVAHEWAVSIDPEMDCWSASARAVARVILATVDAPPRTLAEELQYRAALLDNGDPDGDTPQALRDLATRAVQMEHDLAEARVEAKTWREQDEGDCEAYMEEMASVREALTLEGRRVEKIAHDRAEARAEVERLTAERDQAWSELAEVTNARDSLREDYDHERAEVERLTAVNENLRRTDNYREFREQFLAVQKGAESNAETPDPADVPAGEAWIVECRGERRNAVKDREDTEPWHTINADGWPLTEFDEDVTLVTRLVSAPRVITDPHDLDRLPHNSVILSADNDAWQKSTRTILWSSPWWEAIHGGPAMWPSDRLCDEDHPVTVLWEPEA